MDHPQYLSNPLYVGGHSYAGKMTPYIAELISEGTYLLHNQFYTSKFNFLWKKKFIAHHILVHGTCQEIILVYLLNLSFSSASLFLLSFIFWLFLGVEAGQKPLLNFKVYSLKWFFFPPNIKIASDPEILKKFFPRNFGSFIFYVWLCLWFRLSRVMWLATPAQGNGLIQVSLFSLLTAWVLYPISCIRYSILCKLI